MGCLLAWLSLDGTGALDTPRGEEQGEEEQGRRDGGRRNGGGGTSGSKMQPALCGCGWAEIPRADVPMSLLLILLTQFFLNWTRV